MDRAEKEAKGGRLYIQLEGSDQPILINTPQEEQKSWRYYICPLLTISYSSTYLSFYKPYFDITSKEALSRIWSAMVPFRGGFYQKIRGRVDLYVPFWTYISLSLILTIVANTLRYLTDKNNYKEFDLSLLFSTSSFVYL